MEIPNWLKWGALIGLVVWLISDPRGLASFVSSIFDGVITFFKALA